VTTHRRKGLPGLPAIVLAAALATACGGGDDGSGPAASAPTATSTPAGPAAAPSLESAAAAFGRLDAEYSGPIAAINARIEAAQAANEPGSLAIALADWAAIVDDARTDFDAIAFPPQVQAAAEEFARALEREAAASRRLAKHISARDAREEFRASLAARTLAGSLLREQLGVAD
jgi:hypothetical protein